MYEALVTVNPIGVLVGRDVVFPAWSIKIERGSQIEQCMRWVVVPVVYDGCPLLTDGQHCFCSRLLWPLHLVNAEKQRAPCCIMICFLAPVRPS